MFNFTTVVFDGTSPTFYFTNTSGWNTSSSKERKHTTPLFRLLTSRSVAGVQAANEDVEIEGCLALETGVN